MDGKLSLANQHERSLPITMPTKKQAKKRPGCYTEPFSDKNPGSDLLSHERLTLSSALSIFTSEFEMDSGGSYSLWPPGNWY